MTLHQGNVQAPTRLERTRRGTEGLAGEPPREEAAPAATDERRISGRVGYTIAGATGLLIVLLAAYLG